MISPGYERKKQKIRHKSRALSITVDGYTQVDSEKQNGHVLRQGAFNVAVVLRYERLLSGKVLWAPLKIAFWPDPGVVLKS